MAVPPPLRYAKITPPRTGNVYARDRIFALIDDARLRPVVWIEGPAGAGKTTLCSSYVESRQLDFLWMRLDSDDCDLATFFHFLRLCAEQHSHHETSLPRFEGVHLEDPIKFARRFFSILFESFPLNAVIVVENFHSVESSEEFNEVFSVAIELIPDGNSLLITSRSPTPKRFARLIANRQFANLPTDALKLTEEEALGVAALWPKWHDYEQSALAHSERAGYWIAGYILLLEYQQPSNTQLDVSAQRTLFDYFETELFEHINVDTQSLLVKTALTNSIRASDAFAITGLSDAGEQLEDLRRRHLFVELLEQGDPLYCYHPMFREFLIAKGKQTYSSADYQALCDKVADVLCESGRAEEAVDLFIDAGNWPRAVQTITQCGAQLLENGRFAQLLQWIDRFPADLDSTDPWLQYWHGCANLCIDLSQAKTLFASAYDNFKSSGDRIGQILSWSGYADAVCIEWDDFRSMDPWIEDLDSLSIGKDDQVPVEIQARLTFSICSTLMLRKPDHDSIDQWIDSAETLAGDITNPALQTNMYSLLSHYWAYRGEMSRVESLIQRSQKSAQHAKSEPLQTIQAKTGEAIYLWHLGDFEQSLQVVEQGLSMADSSGIHVIDTLLLAQGVYASLSSNDTGVAEQYLKRMQEVVTQRRRLDLSHYQFLCGWHALQKSDFDTALGLTVSANELAIDAGAPFPQGLTSITLAQILFQTNESDRGYTYLDTARSIGKRMRSKTLLFLADLTEASYLVEVHRVDEGLALLRRGLSIARAQGFMNYPGWNSAMMQRLLSLAFKHDIEKTYVIGLIQGHDVMPDDARLLDLDWPVPLKINTLGGLAVFRRGELVTFNSKSQRRPMDLLKALVAHGGRAVSEATLADLLWPDSDGDSARQALATTLHRLRKILDTDDSIIRRDGQLTLNDNVVNIDVWRLDKLFDSSMGNPWSTDCIPDIQQLHRLYPGKFLPEDSGEYWSIFAQNRYHDRFIRLIASVGEHLEEAGNLKQAALYYEAGIDVDHLCESLYERLIQLHLSRNRVAEARRAYQRCQDAFALEHGTEPAIACP